MANYRPFIDDPAHLVRLSGERYIGLRPSGGVRRAYETVQRALRKRLAGLPISYPAHAHVTLKGFPKGTDLHAIQSLVRDWASSVPPLRIEIERTSAFPEPWQAIIVQVRKTEPLHAALASLVGESRRRGLPDWPPGIEPGVEEWIFHMSLAYCAELPAAEWSEARRFAEATPIDPKTCLVPEVEVVSFDDGRDLSGGAYAFAVRG